MQELNTDNKSFNWFVIFFVSSALCIGAALYWVERSKQKYYASPQEVLGGEIPSDYSVIMSVSSKEASQADFNKAEDTSYFIQLVYKPTNEKISLFLEKSSKKISNVPQEVNKLFDFLRSKRLKPAEQIKDVISQLNKFASPNIQAFFLGQFEWKRAELIKVLSLSVKECEVTNKLKQLQLASIKVRDDNYFLGSFSSNRYRIGIVSYRIGNKPTFKALENLFNLNNQLCIQ
jgi:hypothetical protein